MGRQIAGRSIGLILYCASIALLVMGCVGPNIIQSNLPHQNSIGMHFVQLPGTNVLISVWETRVQDFALFVKATNYDAEQNVYSLTVTGWKRNGASWRNPGFPQSPDHPVCGVSRKDAKAFCAWLTEIERNAGRLNPSQEYRLPTDYEWSLALGLKEDPSQTPAAKDASIPVFFPEISALPSFDHDSTFKSTRPGFYPWGTSWPPPNIAGNYAGAEADDTDWPAAWTTIESYRDMYSRTAPAGSFSPNRLGLFDLSGNVAEWCEDAYDRTKAQGILRGGSFLSNLPPYLLSADRVEGSQQSRYVDRGFRCVLVVNVVH